MGVVDRSEFLSSASVRKWSEEMGRKRNVEIREWTFIYRDRPQRSMPVVKKGNEKKNCVAVFIGRQLVRLKIQIMPAVVAGDTPRMWPYVAVGTYKILIVVGTVRSVGFGITVSCAGIWPI